MDKEFSKYMEISEMFSAGMGMTPGMGMGMEKSDPEQESLQRKIDSMSSTIHSVRDNYAKYASAENDEDRQLYKEILKKHVELMDSLWTKVKSHMLKSSDSEEKKDDEEGGTETMIIKQCPHGME